MHRSQSALEYLMTYGWAILIIVIVAAVLYSFGIFNPSSSISTTITGFSGLGSVNAVCLGGTSFTLVLGNSIGHLINITQINLTSSSATVAYKPNVSIQSDTSATITVPGTTLCTAGSRYSVSSIITYTEPGQTFSGPYTSTGTVSGTAASPPSSATSYEALTINNTQSQAASSPFQQMVNITSTSSGWSSISTSPFGQNVEFFSTTGRILDSWLENYTSTHAIWWVRLPLGIPADSKQVIYMGFAPASTNLFNNVNIGEAPQLSSTYGQYDDGANVFNLYQNFVGTQVPSGWITEGTPPTVNNGVTWSSSCSAIEYNTEVTSIDIYEMYFTELDTSTNAGFGLVRDINGNSYTNCGYLSDGSAVGEAYSGPTIFVTTCGCVLLNYNGGQYDTSSGYEIAPSIMGVTDQAGFDETYLGYIGQKFTNQITPPGEYWFFASSNGGSGSMKVQWARSRAYPPSGVMPSVAFGSVQ